MDALRLSGARVHPSLKTSARIVDGRPRGKVLRISGSYRHAARWIAERPEGDAAAQVRRDGEEEGKAIAAGDVEDPSRGPRARRRADARADGDHAQDGSEVAAGEKIRGLGRDGRSPRAPGEAEEARVEPEQPA